MYAVRHGVLSDRLCDELVASLDEGLFAEEKRHFIAKGRHFFTQNEKSIGLLSSVVRALFASGDLQSAYKDPYIDHAFLLLKSSGGNETPPHQDRPFWVKKESTPSMITCWLALDEISITKGALQVASKLPSEIARFNSTDQILYQHREVGSDEGSFNFLLHEDMAQSLQMRPLEVGKGDSVFFDAFEIHSSTSNVSGQTRLAMKVVFREGGGIFSVADLLANPQKCLETGGKPFAERLLNAIRRLLAPKP